MLEGRGDPLDENILHTFENSGGIRKLGLRLRERGGFLLERGARFQNVLGRGHVGHGAAGLHVREDRALVGGGEDVCGLGHEVHAAEDDVLRLRSLRRVLRERERVAALIRELDDVLALVVVAEDDEPAAELLAGDADALDKLGGTTWEKAKTRVKKAMRDMAEELLKLYAARKAVVGHAFSADSHWQQEFGDAFEYELTPDQQSAIADITRDMESTTPMDRLLCGDVGYGKTEVAMRAAFKAVIDNKQVAPQLGLARLDIATRAYDSAIRRLESHPDFHFVEGDMQIHHEWLEYHIKKCDVIVPLVAIATPIEYTRNPLRVFELDFEENLRVVRYCVKYGKRVIFPSTSEVYGMCDDAEFDEDKSRLILGPINKQRWIYSASKQLLDRVIWAYGTKGLKFTLFRPFNWLGPRLDTLEAARIGSSRAITQLILNLVEGTPLLLIDGGHWLVVMVLMGAILGAMI